MIAAGGQEAMTDGKRRPDRDNPHGYFELERANRIKRDSAWLSSARGKAFKLAYVHLKDLPSDWQYRVIFMDRDLRDVVASQNAMLSRNGKPFGDLSDSALVRVFQRQIVEVTEWLNRQPTMAVLNVAFSAAIDRPVAVAARVNAFLGGGLDVARMASVVVPALCHYRLHWDQ